MKNNFSYRDITIKLKKVVKENVYFARLELGDDYEVTFQCTKYSQIKHVLKDVVDDFLGRDEKNKPVLIHYVAD